jgi:putative membrane protein
MKQQPHMKKQILTVVALTAFTLFTACDNTSTTTTEDSKEVAADSNENKFDDTKMEDDAQWAVKAADGGMMEVALGQLAQKNGASAKVKELGKMMEEDHTKANNELKDLAAKKNITLPAAMSEDHQKKYDDLAKKTGADFDKDYAAFMVDDHEDDIDAFKKEANDGKDADLKAWAAGKVPTLEHHLEMAKTTKDAVK